MTTRTLHDGIATRSAEAPAKHKDGLLDTILKDIARFAEWLAGPPMTERDRRDRHLEETRFVRYINLLG